MKRILIETIAVLAAFLELSDDATLAPDAAVQQAEILGSFLQELNFDQRLELLQYIEEIAKDYQQDSGNTEFVQFLRTFGENFNLIEAPVD